MKGDVHAIVVPKDHASHIPIAVETRLQNASETKLYTPSIRAIYP